LTLNVALKTVLRTNVLHCDEWVAKTVNEKSKIDNIDPSIKITFRKIQDIR